MPNVLVVEDDPAIVEILKAYLEREGHQVLTADNGYEGGRLLGQADVAVLDWMLPGVNGLDLIRRAQEGYPDLPVLLLTARGEEEDRVHGLRIGADDVVNPFSPREVVARVAALLRRVQVHAQLHLGPLLLDASARQVKVAGQEVALSRTEFNLLLTLAQHAGTVLTRERLLERVWGPEFIGTERVVDVNVLALRRKLGNDPDAPTFIETVRGVGYRFRVGP
ncbi:response regulator transcription factor [Deinococcus oregonensis]|uniref:Response regulator transcription factor n=1 Tax=Deinococcus oregonensis TaxID=1805970 RepID=A0ABV6AZ97_9DEIO